MMRQQPARTRERWWDRGDRGLAVYDLQRWVLCVRWRTAGNAWSIIHRCGVQFQWNRRVAASVRCRSMYGNTTGGSASGGCKVSIDLLVQDEAYTCGGISIGSASYEGAPQPAARVTLHMACHMEGACPPFTHVAACRMVLFNKGQGGIKSPGSVPRGCDQGSSKREEHSSIKHLARHG